MRLSKIEIYGFKSFAERVEVRFEQGITGIVGPNGSGKSNLSDAVRWVLGEQSAKSLRGGKMEDVIFGGTEKRRKLQWCEVTLTIDNDDRALGVDFDEVAVTRRIYRNGEGEYMINKTPCRLRDIVELFRDTGVGKEGYSMIGQGRIDEILSAKSEDRRNVFEEAAGIVKYKSRKAEAERRLENTRLNVVRAEDVIAELESRLEPLREQSAAAREYLQLREELKILETNAFILRSDRYQARVDELKGTLDALGESIADATARETKLTLERESAQETLSHLETGAADERENVQTLIRDTEAAEGAVNVSRERMTALSRERDRLQAARSRSETDAGKLDAEIGAARAKSEFETREADAEKAALDILEAELAAAQAALSQKEADAEARKAELIESMNRLSDVKSEKSRLDAMRSAIESRLSALSDDLNKAGSSVASCEETFAREQAGLGEERERKTALDASLEGALDKVKQAGFRLEQLTAERARLIGEQRDVSSRLRVLEEMQRDYEGYQNSVKQVLLQARREGGVGVRGVVANLIRVPRELERAVDMALGGALQNVVVDREEDAKRMIDYLRAGRLGRATFLPISAVTGRVLSRDERRVLTMPGCVGVASELVSYDAQYRGIAESLLGRTVIAENLDAGIAIMRAGRHAFRLVTLEGDVMNPGGSMTGGSVQSRMTSLLSREREVGEHREKLAVLTDKVAQIEARLTQTQDAVRALKLDRASMYDALHQQEIAVARAEAHVAAARDALSGETGRRDRLSGERVRLNAQLGEVCAQQTALDARSGEAEQTNVVSQSDIAALQQEILRDRETVSAQSERAQQARVSQAARRRGLTALSDDLNRMEAERAKLGAGGEADALSLASCEAEIANLSGALDAEEKELCLCRANLETARARFASVDDERTRAQANLQSIGKRMDEVRAELTETSERARRGEVQLSRVEAEFKQLQDRIWEDYEVSYALAQAFKQPDFKLSEADKRIAEIRARVREMGAVNVGSVDEYRQTQERYDALSAQRDDLVKAQLDLQDVIAGLEREMETVFKAQFEKLGEYFKETFAQLFGGGRAELRLTDPKDVLNCGIDVVAQPPGKKLTMLSLLSGGERALTAIAILFAVLKLKPTPFCFLDEIEAALDDANIDRYAEYLADYAKKTQFVVVTHRKGTMEKCDALYGVAMEEKGVSKLVSVRLKDAV